MAHEGNGDMKPSLLGLSLRACNPANALESVYHVLDVLEGSPAEVSSCISIDHITPILSNPFFLSRSLSLSPLISSFFLSMPFLLSIPFSLFLPSPSCPSSLLSYCPAPASFCFVPSSSPPTIPL